MSTEVQTNSEPGIGSLLKGIVNDFRDLIKQQFHFAATELKTDLRKTGQASRLLAVGVGMATLGVVVLTLMLVHLLHWLTLPASVDPAGLPLWACYGIVGGLILAAGAFAILKGKEKFDSFNPLPDQTLQTMKENLEWKTNSK
jgi:hypothetical protein